MNELDFPEVKPGMILYDRSRNNEKIGIVLAKGKPEELAEYDEEGFIDQLLADDPDNADLDAVAFYARVGKYETAVTLYGECGYTFCKKE